MTDPVGEVIERMRAIGARLDTADGVACFNRMYLRVTELVARLLTEDFFEDQAFVERLDVNFADLYFAAVDADLAGDPVEEAWSPLFDTRAWDTVWPIQFAMAGMNTHINHDLALAVVATCKERRISPQTKPVHADYLRINDLLCQVEAEVRESFEPELLKLTTRHAEVLKHLMSTFSIARARDSAWMTTLTLWQHRDNPVLRRMTLATVSNVVELAGRLILVPLRFP